MGELNSSESVKKVIEINDYMLGTMAGGAADCLYWEMKLAQVLKTYELEYNEKMTISGASRLFSRFMYEQRQNQLSVGTMISGFDHKGGHLYYLDNDGNRIEGEKFSIGSGSTFAYGVLDNYWNYDLSLEEAIQLGKRAISEATYHDSASGGVVNVYHVF